MGPQQRLYYERGDASDHLNEEQCRRSGGEEHGTESQEPIVAAE